MDQDEAGVAMDNLTALRARTPDVVRKIWPRAVWFLGDPCPVGRIVQVCAHHWLTIGVVRGVFTPKPIPLDHPCPCCTCTHTQAWADGLWRIEIVARESPTELNGVLRPFRVSKPAGWLAGEILAPHVVIPYDGPLPAGIDLTEAA